MKPTPTTLSSRSVNARLADVEPTVEALLSRCDELLIAGKVLAARVDAVERGPYDVVRDVCLSPSELNERLQALRGEVEAVRGDVQAERVLRLMQTTAHAKEWLAFRYRTLWGRLSWLVRGV